MHVESTRGSKRRPRIAARGAWWLAWVVCFAVLGLARTARATSCVMTAWSGSDGPFTVVTEDGYTVNQAAGTAGSYSGFMYFQRPAGVTFAAGSPLYVEVDYLDLSGGGTGDSGNIGIQYDAQSTLGNAFATPTFVINAAVLNTGALKTAVSRLDDAAFNADENGGNDMRLTQGGSFQLNVVQVRVSDQPTPLYLQETAFIGPYTGPAYAAGTPVDATTLNGKLICGYQGWYGAPGDQDNLGWSHWSSSQWSLTTTTLQIDPWPDMTEYTAAEQFAVPGFTYPDGGVAQLFSSDNARTVLRHFQWMEAWGLDGVAVQRFVVGLPTLDRVLTDVRRAANQTGRTYFVEYDMSGMTEADIVPTMTADWKYLVETLQITSDPRYLHHGGLPVVGIFGFYPTRFSSTTAGAVLDIFGTTGGYPAFVEGAGDWTWRTSSAWTSDWLAVLYRMGAWQPWNTGNVTGTNASTGYWSADKAQLDAQHVLYVPQIYPGSSSVNRDGTAPGSGLARQKGAVLWNELTAASAIDAGSTFVGMFDEVSEGTQILKVTNSPPSQAPNTVTYEGMPSDAYLCFTAQGSKMLKGEIPYAASPPNCPGMTQPTIPDPVAPLDGASVVGPSVAYAWTAALALAGGGTLTSYDLWIDGVVVPTSSLALSRAVAATPGAHVWRVRANNSLGNAGGWSVAQTFSVGGAIGDGGSGAAAAEDAGDAAAATGGGSFDAGAMDAGTGSAANGSGCSCSFVVGDSTSGQGGGLALGGLVAGLLGALRALALRRRRGRNETA
jgi:hypothetical protein